MWKPIKDYAGLYEISNCGRVKSLAKTWVGGNGGVRSKLITILKPGTDENGYLLVGLSNSCLKKTATIHSLVWDAFGNKPRQGLTIDHIDADKKNNRINNLQLLTQRDNVAKSFQQRGRVLPTGVHYKPKTKKYQTLIWINGENKSLGYFKTPREASLAYQQRKGQL